MSTPWFCPDMVRRRLRRLTLEPCHIWRADRELGEFEFTPAAVLIALTETDGQMGVLFTERSKELREHSGEISFPGGRADAEDHDLVHTALREAHEEIALAPDDVHIYGALFEMPTITGYRITSYVGEFSQPYELVGNPCEIESIFTVPLEHLRDERFYRVEHRDFMGTTYPIHIFEHQGHTIWGATGHMLHLLLEFLATGEEFSALGDVGAAGLQGHGE